MPADNRRVTVRHLRSITRKPSLAEDSSSDLTFLLSILTLGLDVFSTFLLAFTTAFTGVLDAVGSYNDIKNPTT